MAEIGSVFRDLHRPGDPFTLINVWDRGSAKVAASLGAEALATTSSGHAFTLGKQDMGHVTRDEALAHAQDIVSATPLPVSGDFENGYGDSPEDCQGKDVLLYRTRVDFKGQMVPALRIRIPTTEVGADEVIEGLYAIGNCAAAILPTYPGPGSTLGPAMTWGYQAAKHISGHEG